jgi:choline dehydrogenase-like flavoprotein
MNGTSTFDYIVVGAGTTGCVVAARLGAHGYSVLLLEAGASGTAPEVAEAIDDPTRVFEAIFAYDGRDTSTPHRISKFYAIEPQAGLNSRRIAIHQGKVCGGGSAINGMIHVRGSRHDYDLWAQLGNRGWCYKDVLPFFKKSENFTGGASLYHGVDGPVHVTIVPKPSRAARAFIDAAGKFFPESRPDWDFNGARQDNAAGLYQVALDPSGRRSSAAAAYLRSHPAPRSLTIKTGAEVSRIVVESGRAIGVECREDGAVRTYRADGEVIVSAGPFESPKLLMLSGIGPADHLRGLDLRDVKSDLPGVGQNLHDHVELLIYHPTTSDPEEAQFTAEAGLFLNTRDQCDVSPDLQFHVLGDFPGPLEGRRKKDAPYRPFLICPVLCKPQSRGTLALRSADPSVPPIVDPNYLQCDADVQVMLRGIEWAEHLAKTDALVSLRDWNTLPYVVPNPLAPEPEILDLPRGTPERVDRIRQAATTVWHPVGTCKMGLDRLAVVDPDLQVYGVERLRVADASIIPIIPSGNTNAVCLMIGEVCADRILRSHAPGGS